MPAVSSAVPVALARPAGRRRLAVTAAFAAVLTLVAVLLTAGPASAHDQLLSSDPKDGATLESAPSSITLTFSSAPLDTGIEIVLEGPDGVTARGEDIRVEDRDVVARLDDGLPAGTYDVAWHVVSSDGHPIDGELSWTVESGPEPGPSETAAPEASATASETQDEAAQDEAAQDEAADGEGARSSAPAELAGSGDGAGPSGLAVGAGILAAVLVVAGLAVIMRRKILENDRLRAADEAGPAAGGKRNDNPDGKAHD